jgi:hypothetical protein
MAAGLAAAADRGQSEPARDRAPGFQRYSAAGNIPMRQAAAVARRHRAALATPARATHRCKRSITTPAEALKTSTAAVAIAKLELLLLDQERESRESPMLNAFCRVAPSDRRSFLAILPAGVFLRAIVFRSRSSPAVQARRFFGLLAIKPPFQQRQFVSLTGADEKTADTICS